MRIIPALVAAFIALGAQASLAAGGVADGHVGAPPPRRCVLLPKAQQPKPPAHATGGLVVTIPATTCNTAPRPETGASRTPGRR